MMNVVPSGEKPAARISSLSLTSSGWRPGAQTVTQSPDTLWGFRTRPPVLT